LWRWWRRSKIQVIGDGRFNDLNGRELHGGDSRGRCGLSDFRERR